MKNNLTKEMLEVFQVCDSTFPIGTFNHSFGMENYLYRRQIKKGPQFKEWLQSYFQSQYRYGEGLAVILAYQALEKDAAEKVSQQILSYDDILTKSTPARETREGTKMIARQMYLLIEKMYGDAIPYLTEYNQAVEAGKAYGSPALVFALFAHAKQIPVQAAFEMYGYSLASTLVQNAVRAVPLGQREGQVILHETMDLICELYARTVGLSVVYLGANAPGLELAQIAHETQPARLFMS